MTEAEKEEREQLLETCKENEDKAYNLFLDYGLELAKKYGDGHRLDLMKLNADEVDNYDKLYKDWKNKEKELKKLLVGD